MEEKIKGMNTKAPEKKEPEVADKEGIEFEDEKEHVLNKENWKGQKVNLLGGSLRLQNDIDPEVSVVGARLIYEGFSAFLSDQQKQNIDNATIGSSISFSDCWMNGDIKFTKPTELYIDKGAFDRIVFDPSNEHQDLSGKYPMEIANGTVIDQLIVGVNGYCGVNCGYIGDDDKSVEINHLVVRGAADLVFCNVGHLVVDRLGAAEVHGEVSHICVSGTLFIAPSGSVGSIRLHAGGRIYGKIQNIDIESDRPYRIIEENGDLWILG